DWSSDVCSSDLNDALILYGSGGKSSKAIVKPYPEAVEAFVNDAQEVMDILKDPTAWQALEKDEVAKEAFVEVFKQAHSQLNKIQQYYEFSWEDEAFGITEHE